MQLLFISIVALLAISCVSAETYYYSDVGLIAKKTGGVLQEVYFDRLGTSFETQNLPFGQILSSEGRFGFTGKEEDSSGLKFFGARYYDSNLGRFMSVDPVPTENAYQYVDNDPLNSIDPTGMSRRKIVMAIVEEAWQAVDSRVGKTLKLAKGIKHYSFGQVVPESLLKSKNMRFAGWLQDWWHHSSDVSIATDATIELLNRGAKKVNRRSIKQLPDNYLHDIEKLDPRFVEAEEGLMALERRLDAGEISKETFGVLKKPYLETIWEVHSDVVAHHLKNDELLATLNDDQIATLLVESAADWVHASLNRGGNAIDSFAAIGKYRSSPAFESAEKIARDRLGSTNFMDDVTWALGGVFDESNNAMSVLRATD